MKTPGQENKAWVKGPQVYPAWVKKRSKNLLQEQQKAAGALPQRYLVQKNREL